MGEANQEAAQTREEHVARHKVLHAALDELVADFISHTGRLPSQTSVIDLMQWAWAQVSNPTEPRRG